MSAESKHTGNRDLMEQTTDIVVAYLRKNPLSQADLSRVIGEVHTSLARLGQAQATPPQEPAVPIKKSIQPNYLVCLEDGKKLKMLKRHLRTNHDTTPEEYRAKWGLSPDYPMVAPNYAEQRSAFAKDIGLGRKRRR